MMMRIDGLMGKACNRKKAGYEGNNLEWRVSLTGLWKLIAPKDAEERKAVSSAQFR